SITLLEARAPSNCLLSFSAFAGTFGLTRTSWNKTSVNPGSLSFTRSASMLTHCRILCCSLGFIGGLLVGGTDPWGRHPAAVAQDKIAPEARLKALKITLPEVAKPTNTLLSAVRVGDMLYVSGTG